MSISKHSTYLEVLKGCDRYLPYLATRYITSTYAFLTYLLAHITLSSYNEKIAVCHHHTH
jgi:hypothetical protein